MEKKLEVTRANRRRDPRQLEEDLRAGGGSAYLALSVDADVQRVGLAPRAVHHGRGALGVEVVALGQAVQRAGLDATWGST